MKNKLNNLNDHLFEQIERLNDKDLKGEALKSEIDRSRAMAGIAVQIVSNGRLVLDAAALRLEFGSKTDPLLPLTSAPPALEANR